MRRLETNLTNTEAGTWSPLLPYCLLLLRLLTADEKLQRLFWLEIDLATGVPQEVFLTEHYLAIAMEYINGEFLQNLG